LESREAIISDNPPFCGNYDAKFGSSVGGIVSELATAHQEPGISAMPLRWHALCQEQRVSTDMRQFPSHPRKRLPRIRGSAKKSGSHTRL